MAKIPFKISARTASLIGKENIATAEGAIIELVKNAYDADASNCIVLFDNLNKEEQALFIIDNGSGMNDSVIKDYWMNIGTSNKLHNPYSENKRIKSGAKGIGRFALDRLGENVKMFTLPKKAKVGFEWSTNWTEFEDTKTLDEIFATLDKVDNLNLEEQISHLVKNFNSLNRFFEDIAISDGGTVIYITNLRDEWNDEDIEKLYKNLEVLIPPKETSDFKITLLSIRNIKEFGYVYSSYWDDYDYKLDVKYISDEEIYITLNRREFNWKAISPEIFKEKLPKDMSKEPYNLETIKKGSFSYSTSIQSIWPGVYTHYKKEIIKSIGPFHFLFYFLKRSAKDNDDGVFAYRNFDANKRREWLDRFGGIKLFRDEFRVRPYGEKESSSWDWLDLGRRAAESTFGAAQKEGIGWKVKPNQIYGAIRISRIDNPELKDTTNREGLVENQTFKAFQELITRLITILENDRHYIMRPMRIAFERENEIAKAKEKAKKQADEDIAKQKQYKGANTSKEDSKTTVYAKAVKGFQEEIKEKEDEIRMLRSLASIGMTISTFTHELGEIRRFLQIYTKKLDYYIELEIDKTKYSNNNKLLQNPFLLIEKIDQLVKSFGNWIDFFKSVYKKRPKKCYRFKIINLF